MEEKQTVINPFLLFFFKDYTKYILKNNLTNPVEIIDSSVEFFDGRRKELEKKTKRVLTKEIIRAIYYKVTKNIEICNNVSGFSEFLLNFKKEEIEEEEEEEEIEGEKKQEKKEKEITVFTKDLVDVLLKYCTAERNDQVDFSLFIAIATTMSSKTLSGSIENLIHIFQDFDNGGVVMVDSSLISCLNCYYEYIISEEDKIIFSSLLDFCHDNQLRKVEIEQFEDYMRELEDFL